MTEQEKKAAVDNRANQLNPQRAEYYLSRGKSEAEAAELAEQSKSARDNRSRQLNPKESTYRASRRKSS